MGLFSKLRSRWSAFAHDLLMVPVAWLGAFWVRFNLGEIPQPTLAQVFAVMPVVVLIQAFMFWYFSLYRGIWRFASLPDLIRIIKAVVVGVGFSMLALFVTTRLEHIPRSVPLIYGLLLVVMLGGSRLLYRSIKDRKIYAGEMKSVLVVGAGRAGDMLVREMHRDSQSAYIPVGFVDDDKKKAGKDIHGVQVLGTSNDIPKIVSKYDVDVIIIAMPVARARQIRKIVELCEQTGVPFRTLPAMGAVVSGRAVLDQIREVSLEDLLGRDPVSLDWEAIGSGLSGRTVLVTGAGGSIGSELCRQIARLEPAHIVLLDNSEFNLYTIELELHKGFPKLELTRCLNDVVDHSSVEKVFSEFRPELVFHAAAYKHVPMLENQIREAVKNNIQGTRTMAEFANRFGCEAFVMISTDKAVNPANVMGTSKRAAEIFCQNLNKRSKTRFITVRFGNVLGSAGSVVPLFREQIRSGGPVTVTHPEITRYFMTIPEASQLILQASAMGRGGEIFVLDMGQPIKIAYLAEQMIRLSGKVPGEDIEIIYTGLRPGEKLYEELFHEKEALQSTRHQKILLARHREFDWERLNEVLDQMNQACDHYDEPGLRVLLKELVPEWSGSTAEADQSALTISQDTGVAPAVKQPTLH